MCSKSRKFSTDTLFRQKLLLGLLRRGGQSIQSPDQQNLNGGVRNRLDRDRRPLLNGRLSWLKRM